MDDFMGQYAGGRRFIFWCLYKLSRSIRKVYAHIPFWLAIWPLLLFWGYFRADVHHNRGIFSRNNNSGNKR